MRSSLITLVILVCFAGCAIAPPGVTWSPDGKTAFYQQNLVDPSGKVTDQLGPFDGSATWSADSSTLYFVGTEVAGTAAPMTPLRRWADGPDADKELTPPTTLPTGFPRATVFRRRDGKNEPVVTLWPMYVSSLAISSDQAWLLIRAINVNGYFDFQEGLLAYQLQSKKLYLVTGNCDAFCFTGNNRVAYLNYARIYETTLDESLPALESKPLLDVLANSTKAIAVSGRDLFVLTSEATFPSPATQPVALKIYAIGIDGKKFRELAAASPDMMSLSPDGRRIMFIRSSSQGADELAMMNADGTQQRSLMDLSSFGPRLPLMPTWHGNDRITFAATTGTPLPRKKEEAGPSVAYDIVDYSIPPTGPMQPVQTLSKNWSPDEKPELPLPGISRLMPATP